MWFVAGVFTITFSFYHCDGVLFLMMTAYASSSLIPTPYKRPGVSVSQLMFADDLVVFSIATSYAAYNLQIF